jgi:hypothetical protein
MARKKHTPRGRHIQIQGKSHRWPWGHVYKVLEIGPYSIVKFRRNKPDSAESDWKPETGFSTFVNGRRTGHSYESLDAALIACVVFRREEINHGMSAALNERFTGYIMRALGEDEDDG